MNYKKTEYIVVSKSQPKLQVTYRGRCRNLTQPAFCFPIDFDLQSINAMWIVILIPVILSFSLLHIFLFFHVLSLSITPCDLVALNVLFWIQVFFFLIYKSEYQIYLPDEPWRYLATLTSVLGVIQVIYSDIL